MSPDAPFSATHESTHPSPDIDVQAAPARLAGNRPRRVVREDGAEDRLFRRLHARRPAFDFSKIVFARSRCMSSSTLLAASSGPVSINPQLQKAAYDPERYATLDGYARDLKAFADALYSRSATLTGDERYHLAKALEECQGDKELGEQRRTHGRSSPRWNGWLPCLRQWRYPHQCELDRQHAH